MPNLTVSSSLVFIGIILLIAGGFIFLAGQGIVKVESITVAQSKKTSRVGAILAVVGILLLAPDVYRTLSSTTSAPTLEVTTASSITPTLPISNVTEIPTQDTASIQAPPTIIASLTSKPTLTPPLLPTSLPAPSPTFEPVLLQTVCGSQAFDGDSYYSGNPFFKQPNGYEWGWITSDPSDIRLPNGSVRPIQTRYVLIVEGLPEVQILNVAASEGHANTWGCWFRNDLTSEVKGDAEAQYTKMKQDGSPVQVKLYRITLDGLLEEIPPSSQ